MPFAAEAIPFTLLSAGFFTALLVVARSLLPVPPGILSSQSKESSGSYRTMRWEYISNWGALVHAVSTTILGLIALNTSSDPPSALPNTLFCNFIIGLSLGYFIVDTTAGFYFSYNDPLMHVHHVLALYMSLYLLWLNQYGSVYLYILVIGEFTNPIILLRKNLEKHNAHKMWSIGLGLLFSVTFLILRGVVAQFYLPWMMQYPLGLSFKISLAILWYFSLYWCYTIINFLVKGIRKELNWSFLEPVQNGLKVVRNSKLLTVSMHLAMIFISFRYVIETEETVKVI